MAEYKGAIHIHTSYSDGSGKLPEVINEAISAGLDFIIITDHNTMRHKEEGNEGWYKSQSPPDSRLLVLVGEEITPRHNHLLALAIDKAVKPCSYPLRYMKEVIEQGGLSFILHPSAEWKLSLPMIKGKGWSDWQKDGSGLELWSYMFNWVSLVHLFNLPYYFLRPEKAITGPDAKTLRLWDEMCLKKPMVAIGGVDAHARNLLPGGRLQLFPYRMLFKTIRTHILTDGWEDDIKKDSRRVYSALKDGHCYIAYDWLGNADGFSFLAKSKAGEWKMGDTIHQSTLADVAIPSGNLANGGIELLANSPRTVLLRLIRNGIVLRETYHNELKFNVKETGVYRIEAYLKGKPWVYTNPIYIR